MLGTADMAAHADHARVGVCLSGRLRFFDEPCAGPIIVRRFIKPLHAHVFAFFNVPSIEFNKSSAIAHEMLADVDVQALEITMEEEVRPSSKTCEDGQYANNGFAQSRGLQRCGRAMLHRNYDWILRLRPDMYQDFAFISLPPQLDFPTPNGVVLGSAVAACGCGLFKNANLGACTRENLCGCIGDNFALVHGRVAQHAYFSGYADDFDNCVRKTFTCPTCRVMSGPNAQRQSPECKLGASLAHRGVPSYDIRQLASPRSPSHGDVRLVRGPNPPEMRPCPTDWSKALPLLIGPRELNALAPGPLDSTFAQAAARECSLPQERRSGQWMDRCLEPCALNGTKGAHEHHRALCK